jgi:hypothetical protein
MVEGELVLNAVKDSSLDSRRSERLGADPLRMTLIPDNLQYDVWWPSVAPWLVGFDLYDKHPLFYHQGSVSKRENWKNTRNQ